MTEPTVHDAPHRERYEIQVDGELAGFAAYHTGPDVLTITHTEVGDGYEGRGVGSALVRGALDGIRDRGLGVLPECPFVRSWIAKHPDYVELVPADQRARFDL